MNIGRDSIIKQNYRGEFSITCKLDISNNRKNNFISKIKLKWEHDMVVERVLERSQDAISSFFPASPPVMKGWEGHTTSVVIRGTEGSRLPILNCKKYSNPKHWVLFLLERMSTDVLVCI